MEQGKVDETVQLRAWCNEFEVVAATSAKEARAILLAGGEGAPSYSEDEVGDEEDFYLLEDDLVIKDEDGVDTGETVGDFVRAKGGAGWLWSCEP